MIYKYAFNYYRLIFRRLVCCFVFHFVLCLKFNYVFLFELLCVVFCCVVLCIAFYAIWFCVYPLHIPYNLLVVPKIN